MTTTYSFTNIVELLSALTDKCNELHKSNLRYGILKTFNYLGLDDTTFKVYDDRAIQSVWVYKIILKPEVKTLCNTFIKDIT